MGAQVISSIELPKVIRSKKAILEDIAKVDRQLVELMEDDRTSYAQGVIDKMFKEFPKGAKWTKKMAEYATEKYYVYSPIGRKRNLPAGLTGDKSIIAQQVRRGSNAPIQGFASEIGVKAGRVVMESYYTELPTICDLLGLEYDDWLYRIPYNRMVHDASYYSVPFAMIIPFTHILQYDATYGITKRYKDEFGIDFTVEPEIEMEFGAVDSATHTWDWSLPKIVESLVAATKDLDDMGLLEKGMTQQKVIKTIFKPWANKKCRHYLQKKYPLLGVSDLDKQIVDAIKPLYK